MNTLPNGPTNVIKPKQSTSQHAINLSHASNAHISVDTVFVNVCHAVLLQHKLVRLKMPTTRKSGCNVEGTGP